MKVWHKQTGIRLMLRASGLVLIALAGLAVHMLSQLVHRPGDGAASPGELALAALVFCGLTSGGALLLVGHHLFDEVCVSERWKKKKCAIDTTVSSVDRAS